MAGWDNPLPIGQSTWDSAWGVGPCLRGRRKKLSPVAGPKLGHSSETLGPWAPYIYRLPASQPLDHHASCTSCSLLPTRHPCWTSMRPHCHPGINKRWRCPMARATTTSPKHPAVEQLNPAPRSRSQLSVFTSA